MSSLSHNSYELLSHFDPHVASREPRRPVTHRSPSGGLDLVLEVLAHRGSRTELRMFSPHRLRPPCRELRVELDHDLETAQAYEYQTNGTRNNATQSRDGTFGDILRAWLRSTESRGFQPIDQRKDHRG